MIRNGKSVRELKVHLDLCNMTDTVSSSSLSLLVGADCYGLQDLLSAYPAVTEALQECVRMLFGESIYKPEVFPQYMRLTSVDFADGKPRRVTPTV
jgi:hypothetical protein